MSQLSLRPGAAQAPPSAPFLPTTRAEMNQLGWAQCDIVLVTGDAYVDHPSFGMAIIGRVLEAHGFRVGILPQPDWKNAQAFRELGEPRLFFGVTGGNMDSMVNRYTSDRKKRNDDAYTPAGAADARPDRAVIVYSQRCKEAFRGVPIVVGGIEASLRRVAHYDYWSNKVRRSLLLDSKADLLVFGNAERSIVEIAKRLDKGEAISELLDVRGTAIVRTTLPEHYAKIDSREVDAPGPVSAPQSPYEEKEPTKSSSGLVGLRKKAPPRKANVPSVILLPSYEILREDKVLYAHASRIVHRESAPHNARPLAQQHANRWVWLNPPPFPLEVPEMDWVYERPYAKIPHPRYGKDKIPAYEMIRFSVTIQRGCFGGCSFCSITEHEGRIIQNRSESSILREIEDIRDRVPGFTGVISDLGGPTANMYRLACKDPKIEQACRRPSCIFPGVCPSLNTDHAPLISLYRKARNIKGVKKINIASGVRYDLAVESPEYIDELVKHHVGGYLKIAPEHVAKRPLSAMMKPEIDRYDRFAQLFRQASRRAGKKQYLIPYFIAAHPNTTDEDMLELALWLKKNGFKADQVQAFLPSPMSYATAMYHSERNPLRRVRREGEAMPVAKGQGQRKLHKAFLRWHDPKNWPLLRKALHRMGRGDLIGHRSDQLIPYQQRKSAGPERAGRPMRTQHNGLQQTRNDRRRRR